MLRPHAIIAHRMAGLNSANAAQSEEYWGRPGFDVGYKAAQGMPRSSHLVNPLEILHTPTTSVILSPPNTGETLH